MPGVVRKGVLVLCLAALVGGSLLADWDDGHVAGPQGALALMVGGSVTAAAVTAVEAWRRQKLDSALMATALVFSALSYTVPHGNIRRPGWSVSVGIGLLVAALVGLVPMTVQLFRNTQDERRRAIVANASAAAFGITLLIVVALTVLDAYVSSMPDVTATWVVGIAAIAWFGSLYVTKERM